MQGVTNLMDANSLASSLEHDEVVLLETSIFMRPGAPARFESGQEIFLQGPRLPKARYVDLFTRFSDKAANFPFTLPKASEFQRDCGALGLRADDHIVIYDRLSGQWAARLWWVFKALGHERVSVLQGGYRAYMEAGLAMETGEPAGYSGTVYKGETPNPRRYADTRYVESVVSGERSAALVCLLQEDDFAGRVPSRPRPGHIPGSLNLPFSRLLDPVTRALLPPEQLRAVFRSVVPLQGEEIITYCGGGVASTLGSLALAVIGYENTREYDGSLVEWGADPSHEVVVLP